jgi:hypothetical protein
MVLQNPKDPKTLKTSPIRKQSELQQKTTPQKRNKEKQAKKK